MVKRVYNFSAGPAVLPLSAMEEAQRDLLALPGVGSSILEISHRSKAFAAVIEKAEQNLRDLLAIPENYRVLFLQGGATMQFAMLPINFLKGTGKTADYILTGSWGKKAIKEAQKQGDVRVAWDGDAVECRRVPRQDELELDASAAYVHMTSNETIQGVQFAAEPDVGDVPLVCDASSDFLCRPVPIERYGVLYACAQKNAGPAGVTVVIIRDDLIERAPEGLPAVLDYRAFAKAGSLLNTPPVFSIYMVKLVTDWLLGEMGGLDKMHEFNREKAKLLYDAVDQSDGFYSGHAEPASRSIMNVTFRLPGEQLESRFLEEAASRDLTALKGHRSVGGFRASIYNAMPREGVEALRDFMLEFRDQHASGG
jgi:phosphoserine aminotransferase